MSTKDPDVGNSSSDDELREQFNLKYAPSIFLFYK
jgi:hypothetical protein